MTSSISPYFPFESRFVDVHGSRMHYVEEGEGDPILFLHGNPTSSYLWRNIIPHLSPHGRCIAPDLIGMGKSDKPKIGYRFLDHAHYLDEFIGKQGLENITLVVHDWGSGLGLHYARRHPDNIKAVVMMEAILGPLRWAGFPANYKMLFRLLRATGAGWFMVSVMNVFVEKLLPSTVVRKLSPEEMARYREPFPTVASRKAVRQWPREIPIDGHPADVYEAVTAYSDWLKLSRVPKLLLHAEPGGIVTKDIVAWCQASFENLETVHIGKGIHFVQEDNPHGIGQAIADWYQAQPAARAAAS